MSTLNLDNLALLIAHLEMSPKKAFNMSRWIVRGPQVQISEVLKQQTKAFVKSVVNETKIKHECGTVACIAGHCVIIKEALDYSGLDYSGVDYSSSYTPNVASQAAREFLGLDREEAQRLFADNLGDITDGQALKTITRGKALKTLYFLHEYGEVEWMVPEGYRAKSKTKTAVENARKTLIETFAKEEAGRDIDAVLKAKVSKVARR